MHAQIEQLVQGRKIPSALTAIEAFIKAQSGDAQAVVQASDWYRRLGFYKKGFLLLSPREPLRKQESSQTAAGLRLLWSARFLNLLGASTFAHQVLGSLKLETLDDHRNAGHIRLTNFDFEGARGHFEAMASLERDPESYRARLSLLGLSDAYSGLGRQREALAIAEDIERRSQEPLLVGIALQAQAEYLARLGQFGKALARIERAERYFPQDEKTTDRAILKKWKGYLLAKAGGAQRRRGLALLKDAESTFRRLTLRPEAFLGVLKLQDELGVLSRAEKDLLNHYPGAKPQSIAVFGERVKPRLRICLDSDECEDLRPGSRGAVGGFALGLTLELRLVAFLVIAGARGVPMIRALSLLWPEEAFSFAQLEDRLHKLLKRIRKVHGLQVLLDNCNLLLKGAAARKIQVVSGPPRGPSFLRAHGRFSGTEFGTYYGLSKSQRAIHLQEFEARGWVTRTGRGSSVLYSSTLT